MTGRTRFRINAGALFRRARLSGSWATRTRLTASI